MENTIKIIVLFGETWGKFQERICIFPSIDFPVRGEFIINNVIVLDLGAHIQASLQACSLNMGPFSRLVGNSK